MARNRETLRDPDAFRQYGVVGTTEGEDWAGEPGDFVTVLLERDDARALAIEGERSREIREALADALAQGENTPDAILDLTDPLQPVALDPLSFGGD